MTLLEKMHFDRAREFGLWMFRLIDKKYPGADQKGVMNYDYDDDEKGKPLRYRLIVKNNYKSYINEIENAINEKGWHITVELKKGRNAWQLVFEPTITSSIPRNSIFWHVTPEQNVPMVLREGLTARNSRYGIKYPQPRVYLIKDEKNCEQMIKSLSMKDNNKINYKILKIDLRKASGIKVHTDPELSKVAVYTTQSISPAFITVQSEAKLESKYMTIRDYIDIVEGRKKFVAPVVEKP